MNAPRPEPGRRQASSLRRIAPAVLPIVVLALLTVAAVSAQSAPVWPISPGAGDWGVSPGQVIRIGFREAMDPASVLSNLALTPSVDADVTWDSGHRALTLTPRDTLLPDKRYTVRVGADIRTRTGALLLTEPLLWQFTTGSGSPSTRFSAGARIQSVRPTGDRMLPLIVAYPRVKYEVAAYRLTPDQLIATWPAYSPPGEAVPPPSGGLVHRWTAAVTEGSRRVGQIPLPAQLTPGIYRIDVEHEVAGSASTLVVLSDYSIVAKRGLTAAAIWVAQTAGGTGGAGGSSALAGSGAADGSGAANGSGAAGATVTLRDASGAFLATGTTDAEGIFLVEDPDVARRVAFAHTNVAGHEAVVALSAHFTSFASWRTSGNPLPEPVRHLRAHLHTDRPLYSPGDTVHYKATLAQLTSTGFEPIAASLPVTATLLDPQRNAAGEDSLVIDTFGSVDGSFELSSVARPGEWRLVVQASGGYHELPLQVEEYVKPDFTVTVSTDRTDYIAGEDVRLEVSAHYYFGQPLADGDVELRITPRGGSRPEASVAGQTGADGIFTATFALEGSTAGSVTYDVEARVADPTRRPVADSIAIQVHPAGYALHMTTERQAFRVDEPVRAEIAAVGHSGAPVEAERVVVSLQVPDGGTRWLTVRSTVLETDTEGVATAEFTDVAEGHYRLFARPDDETLPLFAERLVWVYTPGAGSAARELDIVVEATEFEPGDTARLLLSSPVTTTGLLTIEGPDIFEERQVSLGGVSEVEVPILAEYAPEVTVVLTLWIEEGVGGIGGGAGGGLIAATTLPRLVRVTENLNVSPSGHALDVTVDVIGAVDGPSSDPEPVLGPGDTARVRINATHSMTGLAADAQLSVAVVDASLLALVPANSPSMLAAFWSGRAWQVQTWDGLQPSRWDPSVGVPDGGPGGPGGPGTPATPLPTSPPSTPTAAGAATTTPSAPTFTPPSPGTPEPVPGGDGLPAGAVRSEFLDTAFWMAAVETGSDGMVELEVPLPDNLTTWTVLVRAVTREIDVGEGSTSVVVSKPLIARPALPRFAIVGDTLALDVVGTNHTGTPLEAECALDSPGFLQLDPGPRRLNLETSAPGVAHWTGVAQTIGETSVIAHLTAPSEEDAVELPLTILPFSVPDYATSSGSVHASGEATATARVTMPVEVPLDAVPDASSVDVLLAPTLASGIVDGLDSLVNYPHGCVEQTMGKVYPNAVVARLLLELDLTDPGLERKLAELTDVALAKLYSFQMADGSWGWWHSNRNPYITAYVLHGLTLIRDAGFEVDQRAIDRGANALRTLLAGESDPVVRAYGAYALASAGRPDVALAQSVYSTRERLDAFGLAALVVTLSRAGLDFEAEQAATDLEARAVSDATVAYWPMGEDEVSWGTMPGAEKNTGMALAALVEVRPESTLLPKAARWLMEQRSGQGWTSTQATAFAVLGLTDYIVATGELWSGFEWQIHLDGDVVAAGEVTAENRKDRLAPITIGASQLTPGLHELGINVEGQGILYYTVVQKMERQADAFSAVGAAGNGLLIAREHLSVETGQPVDEIEIGDVVNIRLTVDVQTDEAAYVLIEDRLPAGLEPINLGFATEGGQGVGAFRWSGYERLELHGDRVNFFASRLARGKHTFEYPARAITPGVFATRPAIAYPMYRTELWARTDSRRIAVAPSRLSTRPALPPDQDGNCIVTTFDADLLSTRWGTRSGDLSGDGTVDVRDVGTALLARGNACGDAPPDPLTHGEEVSLEMSTVADQGNPPPPEDLVAGESLTLKLAVPDVSILAMEVELDLGTEYRLLSVRPAANSRRGTLLGPATSADGVRFGLYHRDPEQVARGAILEVQLRALVDSPSQVTPTAAAVVGIDGTDHSVLYGSALLPAPRPLGSSMYLPALRR